MLSKPIKADDMELMSDNLISRRIAATSKDQYGQIQISNCTVSTLFPEYEKGEVEEWIKENSKLYQVSCYGNRYFTYYAINRKP